MFPDPPAIADSPPVYLSRTEALSSSSSSSSCSSSNIGLLSPRRTTNNGLQPQPLSQPRTSHGRDAGALAPGIVGDSDSLADRAAVLDISASDSLLNASALEPVSSFPYSYSNMNAAYPGFLPIGASSVLYSTALTPTDGGYGAGGAGSLGGGPLASGTLSAQPSVAASGA